MKTLALLLCLLPVAAASDERGSAEPRSSTPGARDWQAEGRAAVAAARALAPASRPARNVIIFLGDGMGLSTVTAARILEGQLRGQPGEENLLHFERLPHVALVKTYNTNQQTPDSAGTMTAIVTGSKTRAGVLSVDESVARGDAAGAKEHRLRTLFEEAEARGLSTGLVSTARITHATPAALYAHSPERGWEDDSHLSRDARRQDFPDIARQLIEFPEGDGIDVALGGGRAHFLPRGAQDPEHPSRQGARKDGRDLTAEWSQRPRARYVWNRAALAAVDPAATDHLLGLFEPSHMAFELDRGDDVAGEPSLAEMTVAALTILERNPAGFALMVEAGRIDHAHHLGNAHRALVDTIAFSDAVRAALERIDLTKTLVLVTADHGHVLTIAGYPRRGNPILGKVEGNDARGEPSGKLALDALGVPYTTLGYQNGPGYTGERQGQPEGPHWVSRDRVRKQKGITNGRPDLTDIDTFEADYLQEAAVPLQSETHSGEDVPVYAGGPGSHLIHGVQEQSYLYHAIVEALGWRAAKDRR
ncbi:MAG: alkaline phosphatase [Myxococcota bacterium]|nr:alkaline phosphatase [Myxococcota bacterium]